METDGTMHIKATLPAPALGRTQVRAHREIMSLRVPTGSYSDVLLIAPSDVGPRWMGAWLRAVADAADEAVNGLNGHVETVLVDIDLPALPDDEEDMK